MRHACAWCVGCMQLGGEPVLSGEGCMMVHGGCREGTRYVLCLSMGTSSTVVTHHDLHCLPRTVHCTNIKCICQPMHGWVLSNEKCTLPDAQGICVDRMLGYENVSLRSLHSSHVAGLGSGPLVMTHPDRQSLPLACVCRCSWPRLCV